MVKVKGNVPKGLTGKGSIREVCATSHQRHLLIPIIAAWIPRHTFHFDAPSSVGSLLYAISNA